MEQLALGEERNEAHYNQVVVVVLDDRIEADQFACNNEKFNNSKEIGRLQTIIFEFVKWAPNAITKK